VQAAEAIAPTTSSAKESAPASSAAAQARRKKPRQEAGFLALQPPRGADLSSPLKFGAFGSAEQPALPVPEPSSEAVPPAPVGAIDVLSKPIPGASSLKPKSPKTAVVSARKRQREAPAAQESGEAAP
jgi:hypothetical protein